MRPHQIMETEQYSDTVESTTPFQDEETPITAGPEANAIIHFNVDDLRNHPLSDSIYGTDVSDELLESVGTLGILQPILVAKESLAIISGNSRVKAARNLGHTVIRGTYFQSTNDLEIQQAVLESNSQRIKTNEQRIREYNARKTIESELALLRKAQEGLGEKETKAVAKEAKAKARAKAAKKSGVNTATAQKATKVIEEADRLKEEGKTEESSELLTVLNKSINAAHKLVTQKEPGAEPAAPKPKQVVSLPVKITSDASGEVSFQFEAQAEAIAAGEALVRFLRTRDASDFDSSHKDAWNQIAEDISGRLVELRLRDDND